MSCFFSVIRATAFLLCLPCFYLLCFGSIKISDGFAAQATQNLAAKSIKTNADEKAGIKTAIKTKEEIKEEIKEGLVQEDLAKEALENLELKWELAKKIHSFRSSREQVNEAITEIASQLSPEYQQEFISSMQSILNYRAIEHISTQTMAEIFSLKELQAMLEYYSKPEARSASDKYDHYYQRLGPEITKMLDMALMRMKAEGKIP